MKLHHFCLISASPSGRLGSWVPPRSVLEGLAAEPRRREAAPSTQFFARMAGLVNLQKAPEIARACLRDDLNLTLVAPVGAVAFKLLISDAFGYRGRVSEVTRMLEAVEQGDPKAAEELLPLVYEELRKLAVGKMAGEAPGQTVQPTELVHEAWLRITRGKEQRWENRAHFFAAAAEAMRRILVERARRRRRLHHGGGQERVDLEESAIAAPAEDDRILLVSEALEVLEAQDPRQAQVVKLRFFVGLNEDEVAKALGVSEKTVQRYWLHAKAWLYDRIRQEGARSPA